ncbi:MAG: hypothetical protein NTZ42_02290 [Candidatus Gribaldobacteria bacterium]|nr:hypothetical protein [Candidatus Gribaldobacteria bacterium]
MEQSIRQIIGEIEGDPSFIAKFIEPLYQSTCLEDRYFKLVELLPHSLYWDPFKARQFIFYLASNYGLNFGVCVYYQIDMDEDGRQYCDIDGEKVECLCVIPQGRCVIRQKKTFILEAVSRIKQEERECQDQ